MKYIYLTTLLLLSFTATPQATIDSNWALTNINIDLEPEYISCTNEPAWASEDPEALCKSIKALKDEDKILKLLKSSINFCNYIEEALMKKISEGGEECKKLVTLKRSANQLSNQLAKKNARREKAKRREKQINARFKNSLKKLGDKAVRAVAVKNAKKSFNGKAKKQCDTLISCLKSNISDNSEFSFLQTALFKGLFSASLKLPNTQNSCTCANSEIKKINGAISNPNNSEFKKALDKLHDYILDDQLKTKPLKELSLIYQDLNSTGIDIPKSCKLLNDHLNPIDKDKLAEDSKFYIPCEGQKIDRRDFQENHNDYKLMSSKEDLNQIATFVKRAAELRDQIKTTDITCRKYFNYALKNINQFSLKNPYKLNSNCTQNSFYKDFSIHRKSVRSTVDKIQISSQKNPILKQLFFSDLVKTSEVLAKNSIINDNSETTHINILKDDMLKIADLSCSNIAEQLKEIQDKANKSQKEVFKISEKNNQTTISFNDFAPLSESQIMSSIERYFSDGKNFDSLEDIKLKNLLYSKMAPAYCNMLQAAHPFDPLVPDETNPLHESLHSRIEDNIQIPDEEKRDNEANTSSAIVEYGKKLCNGEQPKSVLSQLSNNAKSCLYYENCSKLDSAEVFKSAEDAIMTGDIDKIADIEREITGKYPNSVPAPNVYDAASFNQERSYSQVANKTKQTRAVSKLSKPQQKIKNNTDHINELSSRKAYLKKNPEDSTISNEILVLEKEIERLKEENRLLAENQKRINQDSKTSVDLPLPSKFLGSRVTRKSIKSAVKQIDSPLPKNAKRSLSSYQPASITKARRQEISDNFRGRVEGNIPVGYPPQINVEISAIVKTPKQLIENLDLIAQTDQQALRNILKAALNSENIYFNDQMIEFDKDEYPQLVKLISKKLKTQPKKIKKDRVQVAKDQVIQAEVKYYNSLKLASEQINEDF